MQFSEIASLAIVGGAVSVLVQFIKSSSSLTPNWVRAVVIALSVLAGTGYWFLQGTDLLQSALEVLLVANAIYGFLLKPLLEE